MSNQQYLTFLIASQDYAIPIQDVREIIRVSDITKVPTSPDYVEGVMNLRGKIIPITNIRMRFKMDRVPNTRSTCIIILEGSTGKQVGIIVDAVKEVLELKAEDISPPPKFDVTEMDQHVVGIGKTSTQVVILLASAAIVDVGPANTKNIEGVKNAA